MTKPEIASASPYLLCITLRQRFRSIVISVPVRMGWLQSLRQGASRFRNHSKDGLRGSEVKHADGGKNLPIEFLAVPAL